MIGKAPTRIGICVYLFFCHYGGSQTGRKRHTNIALRQWRCSCQVWEMISPGSSGVWLQKPAIGPKSNVSGLPHPSFFNGSPRTARIAARKLRLRTPMPPREPPRVLLPPKARYTNNVTTRPHGIHANTSFQFTTAALLRHSPQRGLSSTSGRSPKIDACLSGLQTTR